MQGSDKLLAALMGLSFTMIASPWLMGFSGLEVAAISACGIGALFM